MSQQLTLELSDEVYADLQQKANAVGLSIAEWIVAAIPNSEQFCAILESRRFLEKSQALAGQGF